LAAAQTAGQNRHSFCSRARIGRAQHFTRQWRAPAFRVRDGIPRRGCRQETVNSPSCSVASGVSMHRNKPARPISRESTLLVAPAIGWAARLANALQRMLQPSVRVRLMTCGGNMNALKLLVAAATMIVATAVTSLAQQPPAPYGAPMSLDAAKKA